MNTDKRIAELEAEINQLKNENDKLNNEIVKLKILNDWYLEQFRLAQHRRFGKSSEKTQLTNQLSLFNEAEVLTESEIPNVPEEETITYKRKKRQGKREEFYDGIPTEQVVHELPENERICPDCGAPLHACGHETLRREVEVIPAQIRAIEHVQTIYACRNCEQNSDADALAIVKAPVPAPVIPGSGLASPSLLAFVLCNKYLLALPLYRQEQELQRMNIHISRQTMANWIIFVSLNWLEAIYDLLHAELLRSDILHSDETTLQVVQEESRKASQQSYMWIYCTGKYAIHHIVLLEYQTTREGKHPLNFLSGYEGMLHVDAYPGYRKLEDQGVTLVECWAHVRRKFDEAIKALKKEEKDSASANIGLGYCNRLFELERKYDEEEIDCEERVKRRKLESKPIAEAFFAWAETMQIQALPKSKFGQAITYAINQRSRLMNIFLDGRLELSNNRAERTVRPFAVGRKNWLFAYCAKGAKASAIVYSIIETAIANGLVPFIYMKYLFETLPNIPREQFVDCLPWNPAVQEICKTTVAEKLAHSI